MEELELEPVEEALELEPVAEDGAGETPRRDVLDLEPEPAAPADNFIERAWGRGIRQARTAELVMGGEGTVEELAFLQGELPKFAPSPEYQKFTTAKGWGAALKAWGESPAKVSAELLAESLGAYLPIAVKKMPSHLAAGTVGGAALGTIVPGIGNVAGAGIGLRGGLISGSYATSYTLEAGGKFVDALTEAGADVKNPDSLAAAFRDPALMERARSVAVRKGVPIAIFDGLSAGLAGKLISKPAATIGGKVLQGAGEAVFQALAGGTGEAVSQMTAGEESDPAAILAEMIGDVVQSPAEIGLGLVSERSASARPTPLRDDADLDLEEVGTADEFGGLEDAVTSVTATAASPQTQTRTEPTILKRGAYPVMEVPLKGLRLSSEVPNFKSDADAATGVVQGQQLEGKYERLGTGAITIWERANGDREVISGRHRFDLAKRTGEETIPAQIVKESEGFTAELAAMLDAEMNIRDGQGSTSDYANYFRGSKLLTAGEATARGLLSRAKGKDGWALGKLAGDDLWALYRAGKLSDAAAVAIAKAAPAADAVSHGLQRVGAKFALERKAGALEIKNFVEAVKYKTRGATVEQLDLFGANDVAMVEAEKLAARASELQRELDKQIKATDNAVRNVAVAKERGIKFDKDPEEILRQNALLRYERSRWDNWALHPEMVAAVTGRAAKAERPGVNIPAAIQIPFDTFGLPPFLFRGTEKGSAAKTLRDFKGGELGGGHYLTPHRWLAETYGGGPEASVKKGTRVVHQYEWAKQIYPEEVAYLQGGGAMGTEAVLLSGVGSELWRGHWSGGRDEKPHRDAMFNAAKAAGVKVLIGLEDSVGSNQVSVLDRSLLRHVTTHKTLEAKLDALKIDTKGKVHAFGLVPEVWNTLVDLVKLGVRAGRTIAEAVEWAISEIKARHRGLTFDEAGARAALLEIIERERPTRQYGRKVLASPDVTPEVKTGARAYFYEPRSNQSDLEAVQSIIVERGIDGAILSYKDEQNGMPGAVRSILGDRLVELLATEERTATAKGDRITAEEAIARQIDLIDHELNRSTEIAQSLQAMRRFGLLSVGALVRKARRTLEQSAGDTLAGMDKVEAAVRAALTAGDGEALRRLTSDPAVNTAAAAAVDATVLAHRDLHNAIVVEVAGDLGRSPEVLRQVEAKVRAAFAKAAEEFKGGSLWPRYRTGAVGRLVSAIEAAAKGGSGGGAILDDFTKQLVRTLRDQIEASIQAKPGAPGMTPRTFAHKLMDGLNNPEKFQDVWRRTLEAVPEELQNDPRIQALASQPAALLSSRMLKLVIGEQMREWDMTMSDLIQGHYVGAAASGPGTAVGILLRDQIIAKLGVSGPAAAEMARKIDAAFVEQVGAAEKKAAERLAAVRAGRKDRVTRALQQGLVEPETLPAVEVERVMRRLLKDLNIRMGEVLRGGGEAAAKVAIGDRLVSEAGLTGAKAEKLRDVLNAKWDALATEAKRKHLERMGKTASVPRGVKQVYAKLIEMSNMGAFTREDFYNTVREKLGLPVWTPELSKEVTRRANEIATKPEGLQKQRAVIELLNFIARAKGVRWFELPMAFYYANILSGPTSHLVNSMSNAINLALNVGIQIVRRPAGTVSMLAGMGRGLRKGTLDAVSVLRTGIVTGTRLTKFEELRLLELMRLPGWTDYLLTPWRLVGRALAAADLVFFRSASELRSVVAARIIAKGEGLKGRALDMRVREVLGNFPERMAEARGQAAAEGLSGIEERRRVHEIIEQQRPEEMRENALAYGLRVTYNNEPYGLMGALSMGVDFINNKAVITRFAIPFTRIIANSVNEGLNYFPPVGAARAAWGHWKGRLEGKPITDMEALYDQWAKAAVGTVLLGSLAALAADQLDEEDPWFMINGEGPRTGDQKKQLRETGWIPNSVKLGGRYVSFVNTPAAIPLAVLGNYMDAVRYRNIDSTDALNRTAVAIQQSAKVILNNSFLDSAARLVEMVQRDPGSRTGDQLARWAGRTAGSVVVPNFLRQVDRLFDPTVYDARGVVAALVSQVPFARRLDRPALNALGEPVQILLTDRWTKGENTDPLWQMLAEKQAWVSMPDREVVIGDRKRGEDYFRVLDGDEWYEYVRESGANIRGRLEASMDRLASMEPEQAKAFVSKIAEEERGKVRARF